MRIVQWHVSYNVVLDYQHEFLRIVSWNFYGAIGWNFQCVIIWNYLRDFQLQFFQEVISCHSYGIISRYFSRGYQLKYCGVFSTYFWELSIEIFVGLSANTFFFGITMGLSAGTFQEVFS